MNPDENTFVLETGTEASGKSYLKFDKQAIYQTDAAAKKTEKAELPEENASDDAEEKPENAQDASEKENDGENKD